LQARCLASSVAWNTYIFPCGRTCTCVQCMLYILLHSVFAANQQP
jgi:hypothetical protein